MARGLQAAARRWWRPVVMVLGGVAGAGVAVALGAAVAAASPHAPAASPTASAASSGVTLCARPSGVVVYEKSAKCPHGDTKLTVGDQSQVKTLTKQVASLTKKVTSLASKDAKLRSANSALAGKVNTLQGDVTTLTSSEQSDSTAISTLQGAETSDAMGISGLQGLLTGVTRAKDTNGNETLTFAGENVQIDSGAADETTLNGLGNLIVGFNDNASTPLDRSGSNNLIVGDENGYSGYGGFVGGSNNATGGAFASVLGGYGQSATTDCATIPSGASATGCP